MAWWSTMQKNDLHYQCVMVLHTYAVEDIMICTLGAYIDQLKKWNWIEEGKTGSISYFLIGHFLSHFSTCDQWARSDMTWFQIRWKIWPLKNCQSPPYRAHACTAVSKSTIELEGSHKISYRAFLRIYIRIHVCWIQSWEVRHRFYGKGFLLWPLMTW